MLIYKIFRAPEWAELETRGETPGAPIDVADGHVHFSTAEQVSGTAARHFAGEDGLVLCAVRADGLEGLTWETARGGALFPHLYRPLRREDVIWVRPMPLQDGAHTLPDLA